MPGVGLAWTTRGQWFSENILKLNYFQTKSLYTAQNFAIISMYYEHINMIKCQLEKGSCFNFQE